jgi:LEA14-like dessication related protein
MKYFRILVVIMISLNLYHCSDVLKIINQSGIQKPVVKVTNTRLSGLSFDQADLLFDIEINNPNAVGVSLAGFDYDLLLNKQSFLKGDQKKTMEIKAQGKATIQLPITLNFMNMYKTYQSLKNEDEVGYTLKTGFSFDLPVLGPVRVPVSTSGQVPMVKLPAISLKSIKLDRLTFTGADFDLAIGVENPNSWGIIINALKYGLKINGSDWLSGQTKDKINLTSKGNETLHLPFSISFLKLGTSVYNVVANGQGLNYRLTGQGDLSSSLEMLGDFKLPFDLSGQVDLSK